MANELDIYLRFKTLCENQTETDPHERINAFIVGYFEDINAENLSKRLNAAYAYSFKTTEEADGLMRRDYPLLLLLPPRRNLSILSIQAKGWIYFDLTLTFFDLYQYDRENVSTSTEAQRELEQIWHQLQVIADTFCSGFEGADFQITSDIRSERLPVVSNTGACGLQVTFTARTKDCVEMTNGFDLGSLCNFDPISIYDYENILLANVEAGGEYTVEAVTVEDSEGNPLQLLKPGETYVVEDCPSCPTITADFSVSNAAPETGEQVTFTDLSGTNDLRRWDFGDGTFSSLANPTKTYTAAGDYDIVLLVGNKTALTSGIEKKAAYVSVTQSNYLLDIAMGVAAYGFRKLQASNVYACKLRRSSDNTVVDVEFINGEITLGSHVYIGGVDQGNLGDFVGGGNAFASQWYDLALDTNHATQSSSSAQPQLISSGSILTVNGKPALKTVNASTSMDVPTLSLNNYARMIVFKLASTTAFGAAHYLVGTTAAIGNSNYAVNGGNWLYYTDPNDNDLLKALDTDTQLFFFNHAAGQVDSYFNNTLSRTFPLANTATNNALKLFSPIGTFALNGSMAECVLFDSTQLANRTSLQNNANAYIGAY